MTELELLKALARTDFHDGKPDKVVIVDECVGMPGSVGEESMSGKTVS